MTPFRWFLVAVNVLILLIAALVWLLPLTPTAPFRDAIQ